MRQLIRVQINGLLGRFNHDISFPEDWEFVILHGPNGIGKTRLLELVHAVGNDHLHRLLDAPFLRASFEFSDGGSIVIDRPAVGQSEDEDEFDGDHYLNVALSRPGDEPVSFRVTPPLKSPGDVSGSRLRLLEHELPLERVEQNLWYDRSRDDYLSLHEVAYRYYTSAAVDALGLEGSPEPFRDFLQDFSVHLIETQRLIRVLPESARRGPGHRVETSTVLRYARDLTERLDAALAENSRTSQQLDRTFPNRVLDQDPPEGITDEQIRERYSHQSKLREELAGIAVLEAFAADISLPDRALFDWERRVLWTYLADADEKLSTFRHLLDRVQLLRRIVNSRFLFKELIIDRERGFRFVTDTGEEIGADSLSSGEQHELVLVYDLLFNVSPETTVLIDEPELSLHVTWQQRFLDDIAEISQLASLRFLVATHSPQIIHTWSDRMVALYGEEWE